MKKLLALVAMTVISASALFAENTFHIGAYIPISSWSLDNSGYSSDYSNNCFGGFFDYTHVADSGFAWKINTGLAVLTSSDPEGFEGPEIEFGLGFGGSPIHDSKMTLSVTGSFGLRIHVPACTETNTYGSYNYYDYYSRSYKSMSKTETIDTELWAFLFYIGPEINFTYRFHKHIGVFANLGIFYNTGHCTVNNKYKNNYSDYYMDSDSSSDGSIGGFTFEPKFGVAFTL